MKNGKKIIKITIIIVVIMVVIFCIIKKIDGKEKEQQKLYESLNHIWYNKTGFSLNISNIEYGICLYRWRGMEDIYSISNCKVELNEKNNDIKLTYTLKQTENGKDKTSNVEKHLKYDNNITKLVLQDVDNQEDFTFTQEDLVSEFQTESHRYYITNNGAYLELRPFGVCNLDMSSLTTAHKLDGAYSGAILNVVYSSGNCTYTTENNKDFIVKYDGTFNAVMVPGGDLYRNKQVVDTVNNEIHFSFADNDTAYREPIYTNGKWEVGTVTYYKSN